VKILQVGDFRFDFYDEALYSSLNKHHEIESVKKFEWAPFFSNYDYKNIFEKIYFTLENRYKLGPIVKKLNRDLIKMAKTDEYDVIFLWRALHVYPSTIRELKKNSIIIGYNNDYTFSNDHPWWLFFILKRSIPFYDHFFSYRPFDIPLNIKKGVSSTIFMPTFDKCRIYPIESTNQPYDVVFVGHYENDGRDKLLLALAELNFKVLLKGQDWEKSQYYSELKSVFGDITPAFDGYNEALNSAKVCLSFLSKSNNDTYTRRTLEIPATKTVMLAEYTKDQAEMFEPDVEAVYFHSHEDAIQKLSFLINNPVDRDRVANAGYKKVLNGSYQLSDRVQDIIDIVYQIKKNERP